MARSIAKEQAFDKGETFSGVPYEAALEAVDALRPLVPPGASLTQFALRWILMWEGRELRDPRSEDTFAGARERRCRRARAYHAGNDGGDGQRHACKTSASIRWSTTAGD